MKTNKLRQGIALVILMTLNLISNGQIHMDRCDTCLFEFGLHMRSDKTISPTDGVTGFLPSFSSCDSLAPIRKNITFIHGLGGDASSWNKPKTWTEQNYEASTININYSGNGWEHGFHNIAEQINTQLGNALRSGIDQSYPNRCKFNDFAIAHSQGGIAARYLDRQWDINQNGTFGTRKFYGLVTFGTSHAGADIALTREHHAGFVQQFASTVILTNLNETIYDMTGDFGFLFGANVNSITSGLDTLIKDKLLGFALTGLHTNSLDEMKPNSTIINEINNHNSQLHKIAFYGVETAPECWRVIDEFIDTAASEHPLFQAGKDNGTIDTVESIRAKHTACIAQNEVIIKRNLAIALGFQLALPIVGTFPAQIPLNKAQTLRAENQHRSNAVSFLDNANTQWRYLNGSYHKDSLVTTTSISYVIYSNIFTGFSNTIFELGRYQNKAIADQELQKIKSKGLAGSFMRVESKTETKKQFFPSDGVVLVKSQVAFPGAPRDTKDITLEHPSGSIYEMFGANHFQERNSQLTHDKLYNLYRGDYDTFFKTNKK